MKNFKRHNTSIILLVAVLFSLVSLPGNAESMNTFNSKLTSDIGLVKHDSMMDIKYGGLEFNKTMDDDFLIARDTQDLIDVWWDTNGGHFGVYSPSKVVRGEPIHWKQIYIDPWKEGYKFLGWENEVTGEIIDFDEPLYEDTYLKAKFQPMVFNLEKRYIEKGNDLKLLKPRHQFFTMKGYKNYHGDLINHNIDNLNKDIEIEAIDIPRYRLLNEDATVNPNEFDNKRKATYTFYYSKEFYVEFDVNGGNKEIERQTVVDGDTALKPADPTREKYDFLGWYEVIDGNINKEKFNFEKTPIEKDTKLIAKWELKKLEVKFFANKGRFHENDSDKLKIKKTIGSSFNIGKVTKPIREDYDFLGWGVSKFNNDVEYPIHSNEDDTVTVNDDGLVFYAKWNRNNTNKTRYNEITFDLNGYEIDGEKERTINIEDKKKIVNSNKHELDKDLFTEKELNNKDNIKFKYWALDDREVSNQDLALEHSDRDKTYVAYWELKAPDLWPSVNAKNKVRFILNDGSGEKLIVWVNHEELLEKPENPKRDGYDFQEWFIKNEDEEFLDKFDFDNTRVNENIDLYAKWVKKVEETPGGGTTGGGGGGGSISGGGSSGGGSTPLTPEEKIEISEKYERMLNEDYILPYISGYPDKTFRPGNDITREEVAQVFFNLLDEELVESYKTSGHDFTDVKSGWWSEEAIATLVRLEVLQGYPDGSFRPDKNISRAESAAILSKVNILSKNDDIKFKDIEGHWAVGEINSVGEKGWIKGYKDNSFRPNNNMTRSEFVTMVNKTLNRTHPLNELKGMENEFTDVEKASWYYGDVIRASNKYIINQ